MTTAIKIKPGQHPDGMGGHFDNNSDAATRKANEVWATIDETHSVLIARIGKDAIRAILEANNNGQSASRCRSASDHNLATLPPDRQAATIERFSSLGR
jgi:hypothetical protein